MQYRQCMNITTIWGWKVVKKDLMATNTKKNRLFDQSWCASVKQPKNIAVQLYYRIVCLKKRENIVHYIHIFIL